MREMKLYPTFTIAALVAATMPQETVNPLNDFISAARNGAGAINSALSAQPTPTSSTPPSTTPPAPTSAAATSSAAAKHGLSGGAKAGIIAGSVIGAALLIGFLVGICCCLLIRKRRRRRRSVERPMTEVPHHASEPLVSSNTAGRPVHPHGHSQAPSLSHHPAFRQPTAENPFTDSAHTAVDTPHHSHHSHGSGVAGATAAGAAAAYGMHKHQESKEHHHPLTSSPHGGGHPSHRDGPYHSHLDSPYQNAGLSGGSAERHQSGHGAQPYQGYQTQAPSSSNQHHVPVTPSSGLASTDPVHTGEHHPPHTGSHHGTGLAAGAAAAGAVAGYGIHHHRKSNEHDRRVSNERQPVHSSSPVDSRHSPHQDIQRKPIPNVVPQNTQYGPSTSMNDSSYPQFQSGHHQPVSSPAHSQTMHHGLPPAIAAATDVHRGQHPDHAYDRSSFEPQPMSGSTHLQNMHHGLPPGLSATHSKPEPSTSPVGAANPAHRRSGEQHLPQTQSRSIPGMGESGSAQQTPYRKGLQKHRSNDSYTASSTTTSAVGQDRHSLENSHSSNVGQPNAHPTAIPGEPAMAQRTGDKPRTRSQSASSSGPPAYAVRRSFDAGVIPRSGPSSRRASQDSRNSLPSAQRPVSNPPKEAFAGATALAALQNEEKRRRRSSSGTRSRSRSQSRHRSGGLPTHTDSERPPTPFGLGAIGQPYDDKHVSVLQSQPPSEDLQQSLQTRESTFASGGLDPPEKLGHHHTRGYSTPPQVPSRSPNRDMHASTLVDSSYEPSVDNATSSNSGDSYEAASDPYKPATPNRSYVPPWERHMRYSGTPPNSAGINPPAVPWDSNDFPEQRRHSPRASFEGGNRRNSRSPATSINGKPRRLRFSDLSPEEVHDREQQHLVQYQEYDPYDTSGSVGKAL